MNDFLSPEYWSQRYENQQHGWDLGQISPPIKAYIDQLTDKNLKILIPGCGSGHEGSYLWKEGFRNVHMLDFSELALKMFMSNNPDFPKEQIHCSDFFQHEEKYDLIIEQTLFCALDTNLRSKYAEHVASLLNEEVNLLVCCSIVHLTLVRLLEEIKKNIQTTSINILLV